MKCLQNYVCLIGVIHFLGPGGALGKMLPRQYPSTPDDSACGSSAGARICDPEDVMSETMMKSVAGVLTDTPKRQIQLPMKCLPHDASATATMAVQYGVALLRKMDLATSITESEDSLDLFADEPEKAAEVFARHIHDDWGVGLESNGCGGTGILMFLSIDDRSIFFSRGAAVERVLTNRRIDRTIDNMKPLLGQKRYNDALLQAINEMDTYLEAGELKWTDRMYDFFQEYAFLPVLLLFGSLSVFAVHQERKQSREYAEVASRLGEIDRARAEALQGKFEARSCPICLESFQHCEETSAEATEASNENDDKETTEKKLKGSDGLPLKLLRCGHVFDETCWQEWVAKGQGSVRKCLICQQDVSGSRETRNQPSVNAGNELERENLQHRRGNQIDRDQAQRDRALEQYTLDRNFRLMRLNNRYPRYVQSHQIERWTRPGYDGSLMRDRSFVQNNPTNRPTTGSNNARPGGFSSGFGGGSSAGGRGSRW